MSQAAREPAPAGPGPQLHDETPGRRFWYWRGVSPAGGAALLAGTATGLLCVSTTSYVSPVARALDGADLSALAAPAVSALIYLALARRTPAPPRAEEGDPR